MQDPKGQERVDPNKAILFFGPAHSDLRLGKEATIA